jgi:hypothetical protein
MPAPFARSSTLNAPPPSVPLEEMNLTLSPMWIVSADAGAACPAIVKIVSAVSRYRVIVLEDIARSLPGAPQVAIHETLRKTGHSRSVGCREAD